jgi:hypothetical protein
MLQVTAHAKRYELSLVFVRTLLHLHFVALTACNRTRQLWQVLFRVLKKP